MGPVFLVLVVLSVLVGVFLGRGAELTAATVDSAGLAVSVAIKLIGVMAFFLGLTEVVRQGGLMESLARALAPVFRRLFPEVPEGHPAVSLMTMNISANMLGLGNAATPFGIEAMRQLDRLNGRSGTATNAMALFLAINTSNVAIAPLGVIGIRAALGSEDPTGIWLPTLLATAISTVVAILAAKIYERVPAWAASRPPLREEEASEASVGSLPEEATSPALAGDDEPSEKPRWRRGRSVAAALVGLALLAGALLAAARAGGGGFAETMQGLSAALLPIVVAAALLYGWARGVNVYAALVEGAKQGFEVAVRIIPYLVAILVAVGLLRASGVLDAVIRAISPLTNAIAFPAEALPMALLRPLSGSGANGVMIETMEAHGTDSFIGYLVSTLQGSTETTFYVLAVYGGAVGLRRVRHAMAACLTADFAGILAAVFAVRLILGF